MRSITFVDRVTLDFSGNVSPNAMCLGDFDGDEKAEFCVGNSDGVLAIFKGSSPRPWRLCRDVGHVTAVANGDLFNDGGNVLVVISMDGLVRLYASSSLTASGVARDHGDIISITSTYEQKLPPNIKQALVSDVNGDGLNELVVVLTDRVVRTYQWGTGSDGSQELTSLMKWEFPHDVGGCAVTEDDAEGPVLLVAQPGGVYHKLKFNSAFQVEEEPQKYSPLDDVMDNETVCEILGTLATKNGGGDIRRHSSFVIAGVDGTLAYGQDDVVVWKHKLDSQLFGLRQMDINGDGQDEVLVSTWDGQTFIVTQDGDASTFLLDDSISAFTSGPYAISDEKNVPVLVYATFSNKIYVHHKLTLAKGKDMQKLTKCRTQPILRNNKKAVEYLLYGYPVEGRPL